VRCEPVGRERESGPSAALIDLKHQWLRMHFSNSCPHCVRRDSQKLVQRLSKFYWKNQKRTVEPSVQLSVESKRHESNINAFITHPNRTRRAETALQSILCFVLGLVISLNIYWCRQWIGTVKVCPRGGHPTCSFVAFDANFCLCVFGCFHFPESKSSKCYMLVLLILPSYSNYSLWSWQITHLIMSAFFTPEIIPIKWL